MSAARKSMPMLPWFHRDFLAATQGWNLLERGAYFMLLGAQWEMGALPNDHRKLAAIIGASNSEFKRLWPPVREKFEATAEGLVNRRLEEHRAVAIRLSQTRRSAAQESWRRRRSEQTAGGDADASA